MNLFQATICFIVTINLAEKEVLNIYQALILLDSV